MGKPRGESRGLDFLRQARPQAMSHLLKFFAESARHLDPKTRFLISVVTKVINFSPRGLEQYVRRALESGASPDEVIDAVLCSYPCAGLTRVVDAIDVILDMGLEGFSSGGAGEPTAAAVGSPAAVAAAVGDPAAEGWVRVANTEELADGSAMHVQGPGVEIALFNVRGRYHAIDHLCPHRQGPLAAGAVAASDTHAVVTCPLHNWKFDLATGASVTHPGARVRVYATRVVDGHVEIQFPREPTPKP